MEPITPARFIELLEKSDHDLIVLWNTEDNEEAEFSYVGKSLVNSEFHMIAMNERNDHWAILEHLYESKPATPLDELDGIISKWGCTSEDWKYFDLITDWRKKYNSQLKELK